MDAQVKKLLEDALRLPPEARAALAGSLIDSLEEQVDDGAEAAWSAEIQKRIHELYSGAVKPIPWASARRMILGGGDARV